MYLYKIAATNDIQGNKHKHIYAWCRIVYIHRYLLTRTHMHIYVCMYMCVYTITLTIHLFDLTENCRF